MKTMLGRDCIDEKAAVIGTLPETPPVRRRHVTSRRHSAAMDEQPKRSDYGLPVKGLLPALQPLRHFDATEIGRGRVEMFFECPGEITLVFESHAKRYFGNGQ